MKEPWSTSKDKLVDLEEGTSRIEEHECAKPAGKNDGCKQVVQCVKLFLYLGLLLIVGWACYSIWQPYHAQSMEVKVTATIQELESQNLLLLEEQPTQETSTITARPFYGSEDSTKQDVVDDLQKISPDDQDEILNSENTESSLDWPTSTDYPDLPKGMNFPFFLPSFSSAKVDESEKEPRSSESAQEKNLLENYMLLSLLVQNSVRISEALKDSKEVVDPKFQLKLEDFGRLGLENSGQLELEDSSRLELDNSSPLQWFSLDPLEPQKEIGSDLKDPEEKPISKQTYDNYALFIILNNTHDIVPEDSTEPVQEEALIKSNEQMPQSIHFAGVNWFDQSASEERKHEEEQSLLEKSTVRNAEASEDSTEEVDHNLKLTSEDLSQLELKDSGLLEMKDSGALESEGLDPFEWDYSDQSASMNWFSEWGHSGPLESQKEIDSDLEDSEQKPISTQTDDNYESTTLNIVNNTHEIVSEDSTEPGQEETLVKSNEQMPQSIHFAGVNWFDQSASEERKHEEEQSLLEKSTVRNAEASEDSTEEVDHNLKLTSEDLSQLELKDSGLLEMKDSGALESEGLDPFEWDYSDQSASMNWFSEWGHSGPLESQKEIDSDLEDSEQKPISTQTDDNYESTTLNIVNNTHEIVSEDSTEPEQEETLVKSNEQMHQSMDSAGVNWFDQSASEERKYEEEQAAATDYAIPPFAYVFPDLVGDTHNLGLHSDTGGFSLENESDEESESDSFDLETYQGLLHSALNACRDISLPYWGQEYSDDINNSYDSSELDMCYLRTNSFCEYLEGTLKFTGCSQYTVLSLRRSD